jgi:hypothetical protein
VFGLLVGMTLFTIVFERKVVARMQQRSGPNRTGPGRLGPVAGRRAEAGLQGGPHPGAGRQAGLPARPGAVRRPGVPRLLRSSRSAQGVRARQRDGLQLTDLSVGVLWVLACASLGVYGIVLGRLVQRLDLPAARRAAVRRAGHLVRDRHGPRADRGVPLRRARCRPARSWRRSPPAASRCRSPT